MALTKAKKQTVVGDVSQMLDTAKMTVVAEYKGTTVKSIQALRRKGKENGTHVQVIKNRLVIKALEANETLKSADTSALKGQLIYAFNSEDEVAPAQVIAAFAKTEPQIQFVGAYAADGSFLTAEEVKALASLPSKPQLIAGIINTLNSPVRGVMSSLSGNLHGLLDAVAAKATN
jgi:large subunit ribosomal protein L10